MGPALGVRVRVKGRVRVRHSLRGLEERGGARLGARTVEGLDGGHAPAADGPIRLEAVRAPGQG